MLWERENLEQLSVRDYKVGPWGPDTVTNKTGWLTPHPVNDGWCVLCCLLVISHITIYCIWVSVNYIAARYFDQIINQTYIKFHWINCLSCRMIWHILIEYNSNSINKISNTTTWQTWSAKECSRRKEQYQRVTLLIIFSQNKPLSDPTNFCFGKKLHQIGDYP